METYPQLAVTLVDNHDSQPLQALESPIESWFKPLAYALILLREDGYPCVFYADYYGATYRAEGNDGNKHDVIIHSHRFLIDRFLAARKQYAWGPQEDYFDHENIIGWTRLGDEKHPGGMAVVMSNSDAGFKRMNVGQPNTTYIDTTEHVEEAVTTAEDGWAEYHCEAGSVSVWVPA